MKTGASKPDVPDLVYLSNRSRPTRPAPAIISRNGKSSSTQPRKNGEAKVGRKVETKPEFEIKTRLVPKHAFNSGNSNTSFGLGIPNGRVPDAAEVKLMNKNGVDTGTLLLASAREGNLAAVKMFMETGSSAVQDWIGCTPLHLAAMFGHVNVVQELLSTGIQVDLKNKVDKTPLHMAAAEGHQAVVELLLQNDAQVNACDFLKMTPLHWAVERGHLEIVSSLLMRNADTSITNKFNKTVFDTAGKYKKTAMLDLLKKKGSFVRNEESVKFSDNSSGMNDDEWMGSVDGSSERKLHEPPEVDYDEGLKILQAHGIDFVSEKSRNCIISSALQNGHSVGLTDVGRELLKRAQTETLGNANADTKRFKQEVRSSVHSNRIKETCPISPQKRIQIPHGIDLKKVKVFSVPADVVKNPLLLNSGRVVKVKYGNSSIS